MGREKNMLWPVGLSILLLFLLPLLAGWVHPFNSFKIEDISWLYQVSMVCVLVLMMCLLGLVAWRDWLGHQKKKWKAEKEREDQQELLAWLEKALLRTSSKVELPKSIEEETPRKRLENLIGQVKGQLSSVQTDAAKQKIETRLERLFDQLEGILHPESVVTPTATVEKKSKTNKSSK